MSRLLRHLRQSPTFTLSLPWGDMPVSSLLSMAGDLVFRCPGCGSVLTSRASIPGTWECRYCACLFPVDEDLPGAGSITRMDARRDCRRVTCAVAPVLEGPVTVPDPCYLRP